MFPYPWTPLVDKGLLLPGITLILWEGFNWSLEVPLKLLPVIPRSLSFEGFVAVFNCCLSEEIFSFLISLTDYLNYPLVLLLFKLATGALVNCSIYPFDGGQANVDLGNVLGIWFDVMKGCYIISSNVGLLEGSSWRILVIKFRALSEMVTCSGNEYCPALIFL